MSTPSWRAQVSRGVPTGKRPLFPDGVKTTSASFETSLTMISAARSDDRPPTAAFAAVARAARSFGRGRLAKLADPAGAADIDAVHHVRGHDSHHLFLAHRVHDGRGHAGGG